MSQNTNAKQDRAMIAYYMQANPKDLPTETLEDCLHALREEAVRLSQHITLNKAANEDFHHELEQRFGSVFAQWIIDRT